jgi:hypothetical protein
LSRRIGVCSDSRVLLVHQNDYSNTDHHVHVHVHLYAHLNRDIERSFYYGL